MARPQLEPRVLCLYRRPAHPPEMSEPELDALQERHVAYQGQLGAAGKITAAGPFSHQPDESWRGMTLHTTSLEEARSLVANDPSVLAGRLAADVFVWLTPRQ